jgi:hypothetical protein
MCRTRSSVLMLAILGSLPAGCSSDSDQPRSGSDADGTEWHVMAMEWEADALRIYRDSVLVWTLTDQAAIPDVPHHLCIQLDAFSTAMDGAVRMYMD